MIDTIDQVIDEVFSLYENYGDAAHDREPVSQLEHMSQTAQLAMRDGWDNEVILAAFFHDIGQLCRLQESDQLIKNYGCRQTGADYLREKGFSEKIAKLVEDHVDAKRYLLYRYPQYYLDHSHLNNNTPWFPDDRMNEMEAFLFENDPLFEISIALCQWDELAKTNIPAITLDILKGKAKKVLLANRRAFTLYE